MTECSVSKHLKVLGRARLVTRSREAQWRPCRLEPRPLRDVADWVGHYRRHWEQRFGRLGTYLKQLQQRKEKPHGDPGR